MRTIENKYLSVIVSEKGAELQSIKLKKDGTEYLWQAEPKLWGRHAPILFPIVGKVKNDTYTYNDTSYKLGQHGFARDMEFKIESNSEDKIILNLSASSESLKKYPFSFQLKVAYELKENAINVAYEVENEDDKAMIFSIGAHPGFVCPLAEGEKFEDYYFEFEEKETLETEILEGGLLGSSKKPLLKDEKILPISRELFKEDALILEGFKSESLSLRSKKNSKAVTLEFKGFPYLGLWSKPEGAPFVCIEPWYGVADSVEASGKLEDKAGTITLKPSEKFNCNYKIIIE